jgi:hypothetical protein
VRNIIGVPPELVRHATDMGRCRVAELAGLAAFVPYQPKISKEISAAQDEKGGCIITAR